MANPINVQGTALGSYNPLANYTPKYTTGDQTKSAASYFKGIFGLNDTLVQWKNELKSELHGIAGKDYTDAWTEEKVDDVIKKVKDSLSGTILAKHFNQTVVTPELKAYFDAVLMQTESQIRSTLIPGQRVNYESLNGVLENTLFYSRRELARSVYNGLDEGKNKAVAQEVLAMAYTYIGGPGVDSNIGGIGRLEETKDVVGAIQNVERSLESVVDRHLWSQPATGTRQMLTLPGTPEWNRMMQNLTNR